MPLDLQDLPELAQAVTGLVSTVRDIRSAKSPGGKRLTKSERRRLGRSILDLVLAAISAVLD